MLRKKQLAYRSTFLAPDNSVKAGADLVLIDLAKFCRAAQPATRRDITGRMDPLATAQQIGRQEVFQRIQAMLHLPLQDVTILGHTDIPRDQPHDDEGLTL